jgi:uncharacterized protein (DUF1501 family)
VDPWHGASLDATSGGAIRFHVKDGVIVGVPQGGIFGPEARKLFLADWAVEEEKKRAAQLVQQQADAEAAAKAAEAMRAKEAALAAADAQMIAEEMHSATNAKVMCNVKTSCPKVFALAQIYIATETDQKIQVVTDSVIQTYNPTEAGNVGASIIKMPQRGDNAEVSLTLTCKSGEYDSAGRLCLLKKIKLYRGFRSFIESRLAS